MGRPRSNPSAPETAVRILDAAERLAQTCGFNGFSYADIARELGLTKASLHYHFASKAALGRALMARYSAAFSAELAAIERRDEDIPRKLRRYVRLYATVLRGDRLCLCGMLAAEQATLPPELRGDLAAFFAMNEDWLTRRLLTGVREGTIHLTGSARDAARLIVGSLEGAMLIARTLGKSGHFDASAQQLLAGLVVPASARAGRAGRARR